MPNNVRGVTRVLEKMSAFNGSFYFYYYFTGGGEPGLMRFGALLAHVS